MRIILTLLSLSLIGNTLTGQSYKVLFIGNSYTASNNLPNLVASLASANGDTLIYDATTPGGYTFQMHSNDPSTWGKIQQEAWDYVVLQEQSQLPAFSPIQVQSQVYPYANTLCNIIRTNDSCSMPIFFMTWGRKFGDQQNCPYYPPICTYEGMQQRLRESYKEMADSNESLLAPVGIAWKILREIDSTIELFESDFSHPSLKGSYLSACVFYASLWRKSPVGLPYPPTLTAYEGQLMQQIAQGVVLDSLITWNFGVFEPQASFQILITGNTASFINTSTRAHIFNWTFGDGGHSLMASPTHTYIAPGLYVVSLVASDGCGFSVSSDTIEILAASAANPSPIIHPIQVFPNPAMTGMDIRISNELTYESLELMQINGKIIFQTTASNTESLNIPANRIPAPGIYILRIRSPKVGLITRKLIVM